MLRRMGQVAPNPLRNSKASYSLQDIGLQEDLSVLVRRSSDDNTEGFNWNQITNGDLVNFVGVGNDGFVEILYDRTGNGYHLENTNKPKQPQIVENGNLILRNGIPGIYFGVTPNDTYLENTSYPATGSNPITIFTVSHQDIINNRPCLINLGNGNTGSFGEVFSCTLEYGIRVNGGNKIFTQAQDISNIQISTFKLPTGQTNVTGTKAYKNGTEISSTSDASQVLNIQNGILFGQYFSTVADFRSFQGTIHEAHIYDTDQTAEQSLIENSIINRY